MHHTSGIPDYQRLLEDQGFELTERTTQQQTVEALAGVRDLDFSPGSDWTYSNSNYVLLAEVVRRVSGQPLGQYLRTEIFEPLSLDMVVQPNATVPGKAVSYRGGSVDYEIADSQWEQVGDGGIQTTPAELARWGDNYRTAKVGGASWRAAVLADAVDIPPGPTGEKNRYGAGILQGEDGWLGHPGGWEGFVTRFWVSPDRATSLAVACNKEFDPTDLERSLIDIWSPL
jgi:CubicO group peptidase (beta-lactamase class C family)